jgi:hypothetical protein
MYQCGMFVVVTVKEVGNIVLVTGLDLETCMATSAGELPSYMEICSGTSSSSFVHEF